MFFESNFYTHYIVQQNSKKVLKYTGKDSSNKLELFTKQDSVRIKNLFKSLYLLPTLHSP